MFKTPSLISFSLVSALGVSAAGHTQSLHIPFDGDPAPARFYQKDSCKPAEDGLPDYPCIRYVEGKSGQAVVFNRYSMAAVPFEYNPYETPQFTVTAWIRTLSNAGHGFIYDGGSGGMPRLSLYSGELTISGGRSTLRGTGQTDLPSFPKEEWVFVAGVWDYGAGVLRVHQNGDWKEHTVDKDDNPLRMGLEPAGANVLAEPKQYTPPGSETPGYYHFIGADDLSGMGSGLTNVAIDDIRVFKSALSVSEIDGVRSGSGRAPYQVSEAPTGTTAERIEQSDPGVLAGATGAAAGAGTATTFPASTTSGSTQEVLEEAASERAPPKPEYGSEEEAIAAQEQRERDAAEQDDSAEQQASDELSAQSASGDTPRPTGDQAWSGLSGHLGADVHSLEITAGFMNEILWFEETDKPCGILIRSRSEESVSYGTDDCLFKVRTIESDDRTRTIKSLSSNREELQLDPDTGVGGIEVCTNPTNKRLKGIRIYGDRINPDGSTTYVPDGTVMRKKPNCLGNWHPRVLCPTDPEVTLATGLLIHTKESGAISGLQLICRAITVE